MASQYLFAGLVGLYTAAAAVVDFRLHRIPNYITVPAAVLGLVYHTLAPTGVGPLMSLAGFAVGFSLLLLPWLLGGGGMGDVKMLAALGAWMGPIGILGAFAIAALLGCVMAMSTMIYSAFTKGVSRTKRRYLAAAGNGGSAGKASSKKSQPRRKRVLPFAVPVAMSTWLLLAWMILKASL